LKSREGNTVEKSGRRDTRQISSKAELTRRQQRVLLRPRVESLGQKRHETLQERILYTNGAIVGGVHARAFLVKEEKDRFSPRDGKGGS
jgi:hypothetical protein